MFEYCVDSQVFVLDARACEVQFSSSKQAVGYSSVKEIVNQLPVPAVSIVLSAVCARSSVG
jgi:hypothetical protein